MLWEVEIRPLGRDAERERVCDEFDLLTHSKRGGDLITQSSRGYLLAGDALTEPHAALLAHGLLGDAVVESVSLRPAGTPLDKPATTVLLKPGVTDAPAETIQKLAAELTLPVESVRTFRRYYRHHDADMTDHDLLNRKVLANSAIEQIVDGVPSETHLAKATPKPFELIKVPLAGLNDAALAEISRRGQLALTVEEMRCIQAHFAIQKREPTDCELETIAQTWSEHCSHKTLKGAITLTETHADGTITTRHYGNMLKETVFAATQTVRANLGDADWCVSVFSDNAGVVKFTEAFHLAIKVETHNRPSAIEPYGGANTGLGGVIRDILGTCLGGKPVANTDVFCFAPPDTDPETLPMGVLHPRRVMQGVVAGVRDYGNRMGIPTVNGSITFDERYLANPLVFCGTVGLIPVDKVEKHVNAGDLIVALGGRTGRDGIHGATFSSLGLTAESETISGGAVQIGHAIHEKMALDVVLAARDAGLFTSITDCGAGGFSSAVGEMGAELGAVVHLDRAPLKYAGLSYTEIWISESQERMVLAVPPEHWPALEKLAASEGVEVTALGTFEATGQLKLVYEGQPVGEVSMDFLHDGRPNGSRAATITHRAPSKLSPTRQLTPTEALKAILGGVTVCSKEWVVRQYDHEVQGGSVIKPLVGAADDGPSDAAVVAPVLGSRIGFALGNGLCPRLADIDPYAAAACAIDEAIRNVVAVGADPSRIAILDNFCWGNVNDPEQLGALVRTAEACRDVAIAYGTPFVSGKDSLNNEYHSAGRRITIPGTLLITSLGHVADITQCVTMDLKSPGHALFLVGVTGNHFGGSEWARVCGATGGTVASPDLAMAPRLFRAVHAAIMAGCVRACHDISEGGLVVAAAEMAFAGDVGLDITQSAGDGEWFAESPTRFLLEVPPERAEELAALFVGLPLKRIGVTVAEKRFRVADAAGEWRIWATLGELKEAWQSPLRW